MNRFFIKHKLSIDDVTHLSDSDSELVINNLKLNIEDFVEIETYEYIYLAVITDISKSSVEIQIVEEIRKKDSKDSIGLTIVQSLIGSNKFNYFLEKAIEIGVDKVIPIESKYSTVNRNKAMKELGLWRKIVKDATEQSRNISPTFIDKPIKLKDLMLIDTPNRICLSTENTDSISLEKYLEKIDITKPIVVAIGPEKGWSSSDIKIFRDLNFTFVKLKGNILRTESTGLVIGSIIKYLKGEI
ncbi:MAG TPA: RsmE family RNA methyltransferase [Candidatus Dojkabacteria bacterium]|nr:RsmE family RNA methyltransferase [Candidatus Dojkabacteria bacterium]